jgi:hypothetical protein
VAGSCLGFSGTKFDSNVEEGHVCAGGVVIQVGAGPQGCRDIRVIHS